MQAFLISDTHFNHENIIKYCSRPFDNSFHMNSEIVTRWNSVVTKNDDVFHFGDVGMGRKESIMSLISQLNRRKLYLIKGNHDRYSNKFYRDCGFDEVYKFPIIYSKFFIFSHEPVFVSSEMPYINVHGHLHENKLNENNYFNVSVEQINYTPIKFSDVVKKYSPE